MSYVRITSVTSLLLPKFVDALLGMCVFFSGTSLVCAGALWLRWTAYVVPPLGGGERWVSTKTLQSLRAVTWVWRKCRKSGMVDLGRFPVSDEFISDRYTFCTIFDRKHILFFLNYWFWKNGHVTTKHMEMSEIAR